MKIQCDCGNFQAELTGMPTNTAGRCVCYCDDCQKYMEKIGRQDLLDPYGGTEVVPVYPNEFKVIKGRDILRCNRLSPRGLNRWSTTCCNSPIGNTRAGFPWVGIIHRAFTAHDKASLEKLGPIRSRVMGKFKTGETPFNVPEKMTLKDIWVVAPFLLKGMIFKKYKNSPFFGEDGKTPISEPVILPR